MERRPWLLGGRGAGLLARVLAVEVWSIAELVSYKQVPCATSSTQSRVDCRNNIVNCLLRVLVDDLHLTRRYYSTVSILALSWTGPFMYESSELNAMLFWGARELRTRQGFQHTRVSDSAETSEPPYVPVTLRFI